jgi:hypothetical protein
MECEMSMTAETTENGDEVWLIDDGYDRAELRLLERMRKLPAHVGIQMGKRTVKNLRNLIRAIEAVQSERDI